MLLISDNAGNVYVSEWNDHRIQKFDSDGTFITKWGSYGGADGEFYQPYGVAVDNAGNVYVAEKYNHRIQKFDSNGVFITKWGGFGSEEGQFNQPYGVAVANTGHVYVVDTYNNRIQKFYAYFNISGYVKDLGPGQVTGVSSVTVTLSGYTSDTYVTGISGYYEFTNLLCGEDYTIIPSRTDCIFNPPSRNYSPLGSTLENEDFTTPSVMTAIITVLSDSFELYVSTDFGSPIKRVYIEGNTFSEPVNVELSDVP
ncbi:unnamed protein product, partial [marine sediment metagenome]